MTLSLVENSQGDVRNVDNWFQKYDLIVFGDGICTYTHEDHVKTEAILKKKHDFS